MKKWLCLVLTMILCLALTGCGSGIPNTVNSGGDLYGKKIAILRGSSMESFYQQGHFEQYTEAGTSFQIYETAQECASAVESGGCDCMIGDREIAAKFVGSGKNLKISDDVFMAETYSIVTAKENISLQEALSGAIATLQTDGTLQQIIDSYLQGTDYKYKSSLTEENITGTLTLAVDRNFPPFSYTDSQTGKRLGLDLDIAQAVCDLLGVDLEIQWLERSEIAEKIMDGTVDFTMDRWSDNEKDRELVAFTDAYFTSDQVIVVRK